MPTIDLGSVIGPQGPAGPAYYGYCTDPGTDIYRNVTIPGITELYDGLQICVRFQYPMTNMGFCGLNVNNLGNHGIVRRAYIEDSSFKTEEARYFFRPGQIIPLVCYNDGTNIRWVLSDGSLATTLYSGPIRLNTSISSTSEIDAATPSAVKAAYDLADSKYTKPSGGIPASDLASGVIPTVPSAYTSNPSMDGTPSAGSSTSWAKGDHVHPTDTSRAPTSHASTDNTYGTGDGSNFGHVKLSDAASSNYYSNSGFAATPHAVSTRAPTNHASGDTTYGAGDSSSYGHVKLSDSTSSTSDSSDGIAATPAAVKSVNDRLVGTNLLDNWYFRNTVNQRGSSSYSGNRFGIDRWYGANSSTIVYSYSDCVLVKANSATGNAFFRQKFESQPSGYLTISFLARPEVSSKARTGMIHLYDESNNILDSFEFTVAATNYCQLITSSFNVSTPVKYLSIRVDKNSDVQGICFEAIKVEYGQQQTLAHNIGTASSPIWIYNEIPNYQQELAKCQRYYQQWVISGDFISDSQGYCAIPLYLPTPLRHNLLQGEVRVVDSNRVNLDYLTIWTGSAWENKPLTDYRYGSNSMCGCRVNTGMINTSTYVTGTIIIDQEIT